MNMRAVDRLAAAIENAFTSPNVLDSNWESANLVDVGHSISRAIRNLGNADAATNMGGMEALGAVTKDGLESIASALYSVATAIDGLAESIDKLNITK